MAISSSSSDETKHVAVIPFPFGSHRITLSNLVFKLAHSAPNVVFSYIAPTHHTQEVFSKPNNIPHNLKRFDISDGVPEGHVLGNNNPLEEKAELFMKSCPQNLKQAVKSAKLRVTSILSDAVMTPSLTVAQELNVPWIAAWLCFSTALSPLFYSHIVRQHCAKHGMESDKLVDFLPGLSKMRIADLPYESRILGEDNETDFSRAVSSFGKALPQAKAVVMNFYEELDSPLFVEDMRSKLQSMLYVGFLTLSPNPSSSSSSSPLMDPSGCLEWLDKQRSRSVVYICFGTAMVPPPPEFVSIAEALEASEFPYLWTMKDDLRGILPDGFVERTSKRGEIVPWAPQMNVLGHESVGVYVTHGGMNSMMESVANGVPIICRPIFAEQSMCGRMASEVWGFGVIVEDGVFTKHGLMKSLNMILMQEEGNKVRENFYEELDSPLFGQDMRSKLQSMLYVGFLTLSPDTSSSFPLMDPSGCLEWLDKQRSRSVVYICFGTVTVPPPPELVAISEALEASEFPYLWTIKDDLRGVLPDGFAERTSKRGKIVPWAPQMQVLGHESVGVYVAHSGMNSMMESAAHGVPMIFRTFVTDQSMCGRMASDVWGFGVKVEGGVFTKNGLMKSLNLILMQEEGKKVRENALKMKKTLKDVAKPDGKAAHDFKTLVELISSS